MPLQERKRVIVTLHRASLPTVPALHTQEFFLSHRQNAYPLPSRCATLNYHGISHKSNYLVK